VSDEPKTIECSAMLGTGGGTPFECQGTLRRNTRNVWMCDSPMHEMDDAHLQRLAAARLGARGGRAGTGASKRRSPEHYAKLAEMKKKQYPGQVHPTPAEAAAIEVFEQAEAARVKI
jgi:hypothetical protein